MPDATPPTPQEVSRSAMLTRAPRPRLFSQTTPWPSSTTSSTGRARCDMPCCGSRGLWPPLSERRASATLVSASPSLPPSPPPGLHVAHDLWPGLLRRRDDARCRPPLRHGPLRHCLSCLAGSLESERRAAGRAPSRDAPRPPPPVGPVGPSGPHTPFRASMSRPQCSASRTS